MKNSLGLSCLRLLAAAIGLLSLAACGGIRAQSASPTSPQPTQTNTATSRPSVTPLPATETPTQLASPTVTPSGKVSLIAVGDLMLSRTVGDQILEKGPQVVFARVREALASGDLRVGNLECALASVGTTETKKTFSLIAPPEAASALKDGQFDLLSLANNHAMDAGFAGLQEAQKLLGQAGIATVGAGADFNQAHAPVILERNGLRLAFLGYVNVPEELDGFNALDWVATAAKPGVAWADPVQMAVDIQAARKQADLVVVLLHAGLEIGEYMSIVSGDQRAAAHAAIDAGAAVVIGSHPHQLEPLELYHGGLIAYSLGNFVFDDYHGIANATVILQVSLDRTGFEGYKIIPALIRNGLPELIPENQLPAIATLVAPMPTAGH